MKIKVENGVILGKFCKLRPVTVGDAGFIVRLRNDERKSTHISKGVQTVEAQADWISFYLTRYRKGLEYYFIACDMQDKPCGTVRLYHINAHECTGGSWVMQAGTPTAISLETYLMPLHFAFETLSKSIVHIDVRKENTRVWKWHEMCGALFVNEDEHYRYYDYLAESLPIAERLVSSLT